MELTPGLHFLRKWKSLISCKSEAITGKLSFDYHSQPPLFNISKSKSVTDGTRQDLVQYASILIKTYSMLIKNFKLKIRLSQE